MSLSARVLAGVLAVYVATGTTLSAQGTREQTIVDLQAEKATRLTPYKPSRAEELLLQLKDVLLLSPNGFYPLFDSVYSGGGFTLGAGYRRYLGDRVNWNLSGLYSAKGYKLFALEFHSPRPLSGRFEFNLGLSWRDATQVPYHGLGIDSAEDAASYRMQQGVLGGQASFRPRRWAILTGGLTYEAFTLADGTGNTPGIDDLFTQESVPAFAESPDYVHTTAAFAVDTRPSPEYARRGALYEIAYHRYDDQAEQFSFDRLDGEIVQHWPVLRESWVLSLRGRMQTTLGDTDVVPYFLLPSLGSGSTLRGYGSWRFRDRHSVLMSAEWRWIPNRMALDAALFYDAGTVSDRRESLSLGEMESNVGIGVRFHSLEVTPLRIELARGREGLKLVFAGSAAF